MEATLTAAVTVYETYEIYSWPFQMMELNFSLEFDTLQSWEINRLHVKSRSVLIFLQRS